LGQVVLEARERPGSYGVPALFLWWFEPTGSCLACVNIFGKVAGIFL
jgi:plastocyanin